MNPYEILGLPPGASLKAIRAAYRKLARKYHPDTGGDPIAFAQLKLAHDILIDPIRRAKFDATGDVSETAPDNSLSEALAFISIAMEQVAASHNAQLKHFDFVAAIRQQLGAQLNENRASRQKITTTMALWSMAAGRFVVKDGAPNYLADIALGKVKQLQEHHKTHETRERGILKAIELLKDASFVYDRAAQAQNAQGNPFSAFHAMRFGV